MPFLRQKIIMRSDLRENPNVLYIFGDNEERYGLGGQAKEMRGEPNAIGVATLKAPGVFWNSLNVEHQNAVIDRDLEPVFAALKTGAIVVFPSDGIGTGLANLANAAPASFVHLQKRLEELKVAADWSVA